MTTKARPTPTGYLRPLAFAALVAAAVLTPVPVAASPPASGGSVAGATRALERTIDTPGTAWGVDPRAGRVVVSHDDTVTAPELARLTSVTGRFPGVVRVEKLPAPLRPYISGGDGIFGGGVRCTLGFNVRNSSGTQYFLTAGHCASVATSWYAADRTTYLGVRAGASFPGNDYGIVRYASGVPRPGNVNLHNGTYRDITSAGSPAVGEVVCISSPVNGVRCGPIVAMNVTVNYPQGTVYGLVRVAICTGPGDSGAPVFQGSRAVGVVSGGSGGSGDCTTYYQPVTEALNAYGVAVY